MRELVVARYQERLDWLTPLLKHFDLITVYNKGSALTGLDPKIKQVVLRNIGREGHTYLSHIISRYESLSDETVFCQGDPIEHNKNFVADASVPISNLFKSLSIQYKPGRPKKPSNRAGSYELDSRTLQIIDPDEFDEGVQKFSRIAEADIRNQGEYLHGRSLAEYVCDRCSVPRPTGKICFTYSAQFAASKDLVLSHPLEVYHCLMKYLLEIKDYGGSQGYVLERLWQHILRSKSKPNVVCMARRVEQHGGPFTLDRCEERYFKITEPSVGLRDRVREN